MAWTPPRTWVTGELVTASQLNAHLRDNLAFLNDPPSVKTYRTNGGSIATGNTGFVRWEAASWQTSGMWPGNTGTDEAAKHIATVAGRYEYLANFTWDGNTTGYRELAAYVNGSRAGLVRQPGVGGNMAHLLVWRGRLSVGDYVQLRIAQDSGATRSYFGGEDLCWAALEYIGA